MDSVLWREGLHCSVPLAVLFSTDLVERSRDTSFVGAPIPASVQGNVLLLQEGVLPLLFLGSSSMRSGRGTEEAVQGREPVSPLP